MAVSARKTKLPETESETRRAGVEVLRLEATALSALAGFLDQRFDDAVEAIFQTAGRVVITGIGKSGLVGRKISATLASTGTQSHFVHAGDASHGDLGVIARDDLVLALSNSGTTSELAHVIAFTKRFGQTLVAMTSKADSPLGEQADIVLELPDTAEACPLNLAPTTSTTMMMALGDALAIALLRRRGFSSEDFGVFHPGGALAGRLKRVRDLMHTGNAIPLADPQDKVSDALLEMTAKTFGVVGIRSPAGELIGILTDGDLRRHMANDLLGRTVNAVMTLNPRTIAPSALAEEALRMMNESGITSLFVVDDGRQPVGILHMHDCLRAGVA
ncbi:MAG: KpsF/GutQ family sugar-phosphate isomerase [Pseudomonadota bacterium]